MKVYNLRCAQQHLFEGWFASEDDYHAQAERGLLACPLCGDASVVRLPAAPRVHVARPGQGGEPAVPSAPQPVALQSAWLQAVQQVLASTDDVGERFAEEARRMHYGEVAERSIRGRASADDVQALHEEGIDVVPLPLPAALKGPVQ